MSGEGRPEQTDIPDGTGIRLGMAAATWHNEIVDALLERALATAASRRWQWARSPFFNFMLTVRTSTMSDPIRRESDTSDNPPLRCQSVGFAGVSSRARACALRHARGLSGMLRSRPH